VILSLNRRRQLQALAGEDDAARWRAARALSGAGGRRLRERLEQMLAEEDSAQGRAAAAYVLGFLGEPDAAGALARALGDVHEEDEVRAYAAEALGHLLQGSTVLAPVRTQIARGLRDHSPDVRFWSAFAAAVLDLRESRWLLERLVDDPARVDGWWSVGEEAEWALRVLAGEEDPPLPAQAEKRM
jgi:HEAT repeat protein